MDKKAVDYSLYLVTDRDLLGNKDLAATVDEAIKGGVTLVQIREKNLPTLEFLNLVFSLKDVTGRHHVPFIINDRVDIALAADADGVHIGQEDMPLAVARKLLGPGKLIGVSVATLKEALAAEAEGADYLGVGAVFPTATKEDADYVSLEILREIRARVTVPVVAIGGIHEQNIRQVMAAGVEGAAVVSAIIARPDPYEAARRLRQMMKT